MLLLMKELKIQEQFLHVASFCLTLNLTEKMKIDPSISVNNFTVLLRQ